MIGKIIIAPSAVSGSLFRDSLIIDEDLGEAFYQGKRVYKVQYGKSSGFNDFSTDTTGAYVETPCSAVFSSFPSDGLIDLKVSATIKHSASGSLSYVALGTTSASLPARATCSFPYADKAQTLSFSYLYPVSQGNSYTFKLFIYNGTAGTLTLIGSIYFTRIEGIYIPF